MDVTVQGERWFPPETTFAEDMPRLWGDWGCDSEVGRLRSVLLRRPGREIDELKDPLPYRWAALMDGERARAQHDALADIYRAHGVTVHYVENMRTDRPNAIYMRDIVFMTPEGAILARPGLGTRRGEERHAAETLARLGVPILRTINGDGVFEGACATWVDRQTVIIGTSSRCNESGVRQVEGVLREIGVTDIIHYQIPYGSIHTDSLLSFVNPQTAMIFPWQVPYDVCKALMDKGIKLIENPHIDEVKGRWALNFVALEPDKVVMVAGNPKTRALLEENGVTVIEADVSELLNGLGAIHCMTAFLKRDPI